MRLHGIHTVSSEEREQQENLDRDPPLWVCSYCKSNMICKRFQLLRQSNACMHTAMFLLDLNPLYNVCLNFSSRQPQQQYNNLCAPEGKREPESSERVQKALQWTYVQTHLTVSSSVGWYSARTGLLSCFPRHPGRAQTKQSSKRMWVVATWI